jgi:hypothetical protein
LLRNACEDRSGPKIVTKKMAIVKLITILKKTWANPEIKNPKKSHKLRLTRLQT